MFPEWHIDVSYRLHTLVIPAWRRKELCTNLWQIITYQQSKQKIFSHAHVSIPGGNHKHKLSTKIIVLGHNPPLPWKTICHENTGDSDLRQFSPFYFLCRCRKFGHASLFDSHFRIPGRIVWKICRIPWTSVRWGGMSLMYASRRAPLEVTSPLCCVL